MAKVFVLPGIERRDLVGEPMPAAQCLAAAIELGVTDVVIVGRQRDGSQYIAGTCPDVDKAIGVLFAAATYLASSNFARDINDDDEPEESA